jgi:uncharacterized protein YxjI
MSLIGPATPWDTMTAMTLPATTQRYSLRQRVTLMVNRYEIRAVDASGGAGPVVAVAQQKRMALKEQVTFYAGEDRTEPVFSFQARKRIDLGATYDVFDGEGTPIGWFRKEFGTSLLRSTWQLGTPDGLEASGTERSQNVAVMRRAWEMLPFVSDLPSPFVFHFDFTAGDGTLVLSSERRRSLRDQYDVHVPVASNGWQLDWRVGLAMAVALDALQSR